MVRSSPRWHVSSAPPARALKTNHIFVEPRLLLGKRRLLALKCLLHELALLDEAVLERAEAAFAHGRRRRHVKRGRIAHLNKVGSQIVEVALLPLLRGLERGSLLQMRARAGEGRA